MAQDNEPDRFVPCMHCTGDIDYGMDYPSREWTWRQCKHPKREGVHYCALNHDNIRVGNGKTWPFSNPRYGATVCKLFEPLRNRF